MKHLDFRLEGERLLIRRLELQLRKHRGAVARAMYAEGFAVQADAQKRAPVEFAVLRTSAYTSPPAGPDLAVETGFGTDYAVYQHEKTELRHPRGGEAKYLQNALDARRGKMLANLAKRAADNIASGQTSPTISPLGPTRPVVRKRPEASGKRSRIASKRKRRK